MKQFIIFLAVVLTVSYFISSKGANAQIPYWAGHKADISTEYGEMSISIKYSSDGKTYYADIFAGSEDYYGCTGKVDDKGNIEPKDCTPGAWMTRTFKGHVTKLIYENTGGGSSGGGEFIDEEIKEIDAQFIDKHRAELARKKAEAARQTGQAGNQVKKRKQNNNKDLEEDSENRILSVQASLKKLGFYKHKIDGVLTPRLLVSVLSWSKEYGFAFDGNITQSLASILKIQATDVGIARGKAGINSAKIEVDKKIIKKNKKERLVRKSVKRQRKVTRYIEPSSIKNQKFRKSASTIEGLASELIDNLPEGSKVALQPINQKKAKIPAGVAKYVSEKVTNNIANLSLNKSINVIDRAKFKDVMREQQEFFGVDAFEKLIKQAGADILISIQVSRTSPKMASLSLRATGITGDKAGQILSATSTIELSVPERYTVSVAGVFSNGREKEKYKSSLESGVTNYKEISLTSSKGVYDIDFLVKAEYSYSESREKTAASREAEQSKKMLGVFGNIMGGMGKQGSNPLGSVMSGIGSSTDTTAHEKVVLTVNVFTELKDEINGRIFKDTKEHIINLPGDADTPMKRTKLQSSLRKLLEMSGKAVIAKAIGKPIPSSESSNDSNKLD